MEFALEMKLEGKYPEVRKAFILKALRRKKVEVGEKSDREVPVLITDNKVEAKKHENKPGAFTVLVLANSISSSYTYNITAADDFQENFPKFLARVN